MRRIAYVLSFLLIGACAPQRAAEPAPVPQATPAEAPTPTPRATPAPAHEGQEQAQRAAEAWLRHIDTGDHRRSWTEAAQMFRQAVTPEQWDQAVTQARGPLGEVRTRTLRDAQFHTQLPNVPAGEYMILIFDARYTAADRAVAEQVVLAREPDDQWRVAGYFVR